MFDSLKAAGALAGLMKNKEALKQSGERIKQRLSELRAAGSSGGGAVRATISGDMKLIAITLEPAVCMGLASGSELEKERAREQVQQLIVEAVNNASDIAKSMAQREIAKEAEALGLPNMPGLEGLLG